MRNEICRLVVYPLSEAVEAGYTLALSVGLTVGSINVLHGSKNLLVQVKEIRSLKNNEKIWQSAVSKFRRIQTSKCMLLKRYRKKRKK